MTSGGSHEGRSNRGRAGTLALLVLLLCGHFGAATPASRRLNRQSMIGLAIVVLSIVAANLLPDRALLLAGLIFIGGMAGGTAWTLLAYRRYFATLDESSRRIQLEAIAFAFPAMLFLGLTAGATAMVTDLTIRPLWIVLAEPLRGVGLVLAARKYQ